jgi:hypothetical protein
MKKFIELNATWKENQVDINEKITFLLIPKTSISPAKIPIPSTVSLIVSKLLRDSKQEEMLNRLKVKLGKTKEEIYQIVSEL